MNASSFGRLEEVDLRRGWEYEDKDFTPWLAQPENLELVSKAIGVELELVKKEQEVGPFRADIFCKDVVTGRSVVIENQLGKSDHPHLGQLLTYAAGLDGVLLVWIAAAFTDEHLAVLTWLNEISDERLNVFGLEIQLWRIADSPIAPRFNVVCRPDSWTGTISSKKHAGFSELQQARFEFWSSYKKLVEDESRIACSKPTPDSWVYHTLGSSDFVLTSVASTWNTEKKSGSGGEIRVELAMQSPSSKSYFALLEKRRPEIEGDIGPGLHWYSVDSTRQCRIYLRKDADIMDRNAWPEMQKWLFERLQTFQRVFSAIIPTLVLPEKESTEKRTPDEQ